MTDARRLVDRLWPYCNAARAEIDAVAAALEAAAGLDNLHQRGGEAA